MKWIQKTLTMIALLNVVIGPLAEAQNAVANAPTSQTAVGQGPAGGNAEAVQYTYVEDTANNRILVKDPSGEQVAEIPITPAEKLRTFSPQNINDALKTAMVRARTSAGSSWTHSVKNLPMESAVFFMAMGAVVAGNLILNYSQNPVAMDQHIQHSMSPVGTLGFFTFMYTQGVTANLLQMYLRRPIYHHMIPYLGMTVGSFTQTYLSQIVSDPNVKACAGVMIGKAVSRAQLEAGVDPDPCGKAYEYLVLRKKIWEFAPGIVSMLISTGVASGLQFTASVSRRVISAHMVRITGVQIGMWLVPGGMQFKGMRLLLTKGLQVSLFTAIDLLIMRHVTYIWKNIFDGKDFYDQNDRLNEKMNAMKRDRWAKEDKALELEIKDFRNKMSTWRMTNMSDVYEAHQNWTQAIQQLTSMFNSSFSFYNSFVTEARNSRFNVSPVKLLERQYPLNGVLPKGLVEGRDDLYLTHPGVIEGMQKGSVEDAFKKIDTVLASPEARSFQPLEKRSLAKIADLLRGVDDLEKVAQGLSEFNLLRQNTQRSPYASMGLKEFIEELTKILGSPRPAMGPGEGYAAAFEKAPTTAATVRGTSFYRQVGNVLTPKITDFFIMQMICGPDVDKGEKVIRNSSGFPSVFVPPALKKPDVNFHVCLGSSHPSPARNIYNEPVRYDGTEAYKGYVSYLLAEGRATAFGTQEAATFENWWNTKTESQMRAAFEEFSKEYEKIVVKMIRGVYFEGRGLFNGTRPVLTLVNRIPGVRNLLSPETRRRVQEGGPVMNGGMNSAFQEQRVYLAILEDLLKPAPVFNVEISGILEKAPSHPRTLAVEAQFAKLNELIKRIRIESVEGREVIRSDIENSELEAQLVETQEALTNLAKALGVADALNSSSAPGASPSSRAPVPPPPSFSMVPAPAAADTAPSATPAIPEIVAEVTLNKQQRDVAVTVLELLQSLATEVMMYGSMANAVSWDKIRNTKEVDAQRQRYNNEAQARLNQIRSMTLGRAAPATVTQRSQPSSTGQELNQELNNGERPD